MGNTDVIIMAQRQNNANRKEQDNGLQQSIRRTRIKQEDA